MQDTNEILIGFVRRNQLIIIVIYFNCCLVDKALKYAQGVKIGTSVNFAPALSTMK